MLKSVFLNKTKFNVDEDKKEFEGLRIEIDINRCRNTGRILLFLNFILILVDLLVYKPLRKNINAYTYLYYSHIIIVILISLWLAALRFIKNINHRIMQYIFINVIIYWCVFMGLNSINISGQISAYIIGVLGVSLFFYLSPMESIFIYLSSFIVFIVGLLFLVPDSKMLYSHIINSGFVVLCSFIGSDIIYSSFLKDFVNNKAILDSKAELEATNLKLREYEKLRTDFFANISHELRTPLNIIYSSQQMMELILKSDKFEKTRVDKYLKIMKQNSFRLIRLINNLIDITKIDATLFEIRPINCDIVKIVENITLSAADYIESKGIELVFDTEVEEKIIACDPDKIERIVLNLLSNAVKFTSKHGQIYVNIYLKNDRVYISVKDNGIGIDENMKELIFDRFIQVDKSISRNREGSGIGLALVKSLVELHDGNIEVRSTLGKGSEFIFDLPDKIIESSCEEDYFSNLCEQRVEKINIEFSDIYE
ncbi:histidine kinase [Fervidicella metallireducens AeB]|uniref:histidine kinase n=1 Tax=Fervidicella metallireducens AeB TaxID=1403537 RepID=A0A017RTL3_9CLOT|nr:HAMP domain-containing sensor histidine kinase [Fervidicella metallireducens]EYE87804.1 histidine kinase [Fervidicella metallireducens AeB]